MKVKPQKIEHGQKPQLGCSQVPSMGHFVEESGVSSQQVMEGIRSAVQLA